MFFLLVVAITLGGHSIFGRSRDLKRKTSKTQAACVFLQWNKCLNVECIQMQKLFVFRSRDLPNMVMTIESDGNLQ